MVIPADFTSGNAGFCSLTAAAKLVIEFSTTGQVRWTANYGGSNWTATTNTFALNSPHAVNVFFAWGSELANVDNIAEGTFSANIGTGDGASVANFVSAPGYGAFNGYTGEMGLLAGGNAATLAALSANQKTYWGF